MMYNLVIEPGSPKPKRLPNKPLDLPNEPRVTAPGGRSLLQEVTGAVTEKALRTNIDMSIMGSAIPNLKFNQMLVR